MDGESPPQSIVSNRSSRPSSARRGRISQDAEKRNKEILSLVRQMSARNVLQDDSESSSGTDSNDNEDHHAPYNKDESQIANANIPDGCYDPKEFEHLVVSPEIKDLFAYIMKYSPQSIELECKLAPFIPDFIPAIGDIDAFIKIARPDGLESGLGLTVLDEPCTKQSDPAVLLLQLKAATKESSAKKEVVKKIENVAKHHKAVDKWIKDIMELHKSKPSSSFMYFNPMPDVDALMQEWLPQSEPQLERLENLVENIDCDLTSLVDIVCSIVDIPVYESRIESLHLLFSLYSAVRNLQLKADPAATYVEN